MAVKPALIMNMVKGLTAGRIVEACHLRSE